MLKKLLLKVIIFSLFLSFTSIQNNYSMDNVKKIVFKEYKNNGINVQHFYFENINKSDIVEKTKENMLLKNYLVSRRADGTVIKSIDGGLNWYPFISGSSQELNFELYPNPVADILNVRLENVQEQIQIISIYDITGKIMNDYVMINIISKSLDVHNLPSGMYILTLSSNSCKNNALQFFKQ